MDPPMAGRAEDAAAQAIEMHRDDRNRPSLDDALEPALKGAITPVRRQLPLGKQADQLPSSSAVPASRNACRIIFGPPLGEIGMAFIDRDPTDQSAG